MLPTRSQEKFSNTQLNQDRHFYNCIDQLSLTSLLSSSGIACWVFDQATMSFNVCPTFKNLLGLANKNRFSFTELFRLLCPASRSRLTSEIRKACLKESEFSVQFMTRNATGGPGRWFKLTGRGTYTNRSYMGTLMEITDEKSREIWNNDRMALLSHELKGPLSVIRLYLQRASQIASAKSVRDAELFLNKADEQVSTMSTLMDDLLENSVENPSNLNLTYTTFDLAGAVNDAITNLKLRHPDRNFIVKIGSWLSLRADRPKIIQVLTNYITNAIKYSADNTPIKINAVKINNEICVSVEDKGTGISQEHQLKVFERYYRIPGAKAKGYGLGLYLVKEIIAGHGGRVWVSSILGKGSCFCFSLPISSNKHS
ncbi:HAMP domain-containing histidine kinase [Mucilaginibacter pallidiroseus]|uniref:histidine kinase n=1 Tax=Mucilaginibacter pallidiroseus TaxID=2599295 RepID=A0A563UE64_9SPHI|nr:HAMP domain-containing sensor histidine kinase [Mucilaginibacter pallidiroseus]TWR29638.1 HAMP domain-containing histidine kinase [Mucilaginibacter pallidiroseus]